MLPSTVRRLVTPRVSSGAVPLPGVAPLAAAVPLLAAPQLAFAPAVG